MTTPQQSNEWQRLSSATSLGDIIARTVADFAPLPVRDVLLCDNGTFAVPAGWHLAAPGSSAELPVRAAVTGHRSRGGWQGCDTLAAFGFTVITPVEVGTENAACTLRDLGASGIQTHLLDVRVMSGVWAVRSTGYFTAAGLRMWAQFSTYVACSRLPGKGQLIEHSLFVTTQCRTQLRNDINGLSDTVHTAFCTMFDALC
jgi:hypothetical protein